MANISFSNLTRGIALSQDEGIMEAEGKHAAFWIGCCDCSIMGHRQGWGVAAAKMRLQIPYWDFSFFGKFPNRTPAVNQTREHV